MTLRIAPCGCLINPGSYCAIHPTTTHTHAEQRRTHRRHRDGRNTMAWRRFSKQVILEAGGQCEAQLPGCTGTATTTHLVGGGHHGNSAENIYHALCRSCHGRIDGGVGHRTPSNAPAASHPRTRVEV